MQQPTQAPPENQIELLNALFTPALSCDDLKNRLDIISRDLVLGKYDEDDLLFIRHRMKLINLILLASEQSLSQWSTIPEAKKELLKQENPEIGKIMDSEEKPFFRAAKIYFKELANYIESNRGFEGFTFKMMKTDFTQQKVLHDLTERMELGRKQEPDSSLQQPASKKAKGWDPRGFKLRSPFL